MAYKFQMGTAILSGALTPSLDDKFDLGTSTLEWKDGYFDGTLNTDALTATGTSTLTTVDINGGNIDATVIGATAALAGTFTAVVGTTGTYSGVLKTDDTTAATSVSAAALVCDGGAGIALDLLVGDDITLISDQAVLGFGADTDTTLTHVADTGILLNSTRQMQFGDSGTHIAQSADGVLKLTSDAAVEVSVGAAGMKVTGTTPLITIGDGGAEDSALVFDGNGQDYYIGLDETDDILKIGLGAAVGTTGALFIDASQNVAMQNDATVGDDLSLVSDAAILNFGADSDVKLTHVADTGLLLNSTMAIQFNDSTQYIKASSGADLDIAATTDINMDCTTVDINGILDVSGVSTLAGVVTATAGVKPAADDGAPLGLAGTAFSDLFLAEGGVINWDSGDMTMTQASNVLTVAGGTLTATLTNAFSDAANSGLSGTAYDGSAAVADWSLDLNDLTAAVVDVAADSIAIVDANDSNASRKESIVDLVAAMAGTGLTASSGQLNASAASAPNGIADADATLTESFNYATAAITANRTWTLPATNTAGLSIGDVVSVKAAAISAGFHIIIAPADTDTIDGSTDSIFLDASYSAVQLKFVANDTWMIF
jgi:hypothetical protein